MEDSSFTVVGKDGIHASVGRHVRLGFYGQSIILSNVGIMHSTLLTRNGHNAGNGFAGLNLDVVARYNNRRIRIPTSKNVRHTADWCTIEDKYHVVGIPVERKDYTDKRISSRIHSILKFNVGAQFRRVELAKNAFRKHSVANTGPLSVELLGRVGGCMYK